MHSSGEHPPRTRGTSGRPVHNLGYVYLLSSPSSPVLQDISRIGLRRDEITRCGEVQLPGFWPERCHQARVTRPHDRAAFPHGHGSDSLPTFVYNCGTAMSTAYAVPCRGKYRRQRRLEMRAGRRLDVDVVWGIELDINSPSLGLV